jgi:hypothetical protein
MTPATRLSLALATILEPEGLPDRVGAGNASGYVDLGFCLNARSRRARLRELRDLPESPRSPTVGGPSKLVDTGSVNHAHRVTAANRDPDDAHPGQRRWPRIRSPHRDTVAMEAPTRSRQRPLTNGRFGPIA